MNRNSENQEEINEIEKAKLWKTCQIHFRCVNEISPLNKIYANILVEPEPARAMIECFQLFVNDEHRVDFERTSHNISIAGFDTGKSDKVQIWIEAIPINNKWEKKKTKTYDASFITQSTHLNPVVQFELVEEKSFTIHVKWRHIGDHIKKYILLLDDKEIKYIYQRDFQSQFEMCIHNIERGPEHTIQIKGKSKEKKQDCQSDLIYLTQPHNKDRLDMEILQVQEEFIPQKLKPYIKVEMKEEDDDDEEYPSSSSPEPISFQNTALELLEKLRRQIQERNHRHRQAH